MTKAYKPVTEQVTLCYQEDEHVIYENDLLETISDRNYTMEELLNAVACKIPLPFKNCLSYDINNPPHIYDKITLGINHYGYDGACEVNFYGHRVETENERNLRLIKQRKIKETKKAQRKLSEEQERKLLKELQEKYKDE